MAQGQYIPMVEEGKYWIYKNYSSDYEPPQAVSGHAITFLGDTVINLMNYKKVYKLLLKGHHNCPFPPCFDFTFPYQSESKELIAFIREDTVEKKVFNLPYVNFGFCDTTEYLWFDFSKGIGDTLNSCLYEFIGADPVQYPDFGLVDSIHSTERFGKLRNTLFTTGFDLSFDPATTTILILEGVGLEYFGLFQNPLSLLDDFCEGGMFQCQLLSSNSDPESEKPINIFPNPTTGIVNFSPEESALKSIRVYSATGVLQNEFINTHTIDLGNLARGVYFLELTSSNNQRMITKIIKEN